MRRGWNADPSQTGAIFERTTPRIATSGALTIGREGGAADAAQRRDGEGRALHFGGRKLAGAGLFREGAKLAGKVDDALLVDVLDDRDDEAIGRVDGDADVPIAAQNQGVAAGLRAALKFGKAFSVETAARMRSGSSETR